MGWVNCHRLLGKTVIWNTGGAWHSFQHEQEMLGGTRCQTGNKSDSLSDSATPFLPVDNTEKQHSLQFTVLAYRKAFILSTSPFWCTEWYPGIGNREQSFSKSLVDNQVATKTLRVWYCQRATGPSCHKDCPIAVFSPPPGTRRTICSFISSLVPSVAHQHRALQLN